jgi:hypothetical protein
MPNKDLIKRNSFAGPRKIMYYALLRAKLYTGLTYAQRKCDENLLTILTMLADNELA